MIGLKGAVLYRWFLPLFLLTPMAGWAQPFDPYSVELDSLQGWLESRLQNVSEDSLSYSLCHLALQRAEKENNPEALAKAYYQLAEWHNYHFYYFEEADSAIYYDLKAIEGYERLGDELMVARVYFFLGYDNEGLGRYEEAEQATLESLRRYEALDNEKGVADAYGSLSLIYSQLGDTAKAIQYGEEGVAILENQPDYDYIALDYAQMADVYLIAQNLDKIEFYANKAIAGFEAGFPGHQEIWEYYRSYEARSFVHIERGDYDLALADLQFALDSASHHLSDSLVQDLLLNIGRVHNLKGDFSKAIPPLEEAYAFMKRYDIETAEVHEELARSLAGTGAYQKALFHQTRAGELETEISKTRINSMESELLAKYEADQKDATIATQQLSLAQQQRIQWLVGGIAALLLIILLLLYRNFRNNQRTNSRLQDLNSELVGKNNQNEMLVREIHHRVKNNLETVSGLLELQSLRLDDEEAQEALLASQTRVESMGIIHRKLYQGTRTSRVEMKAYFRDLGDSLLHAYHAQGRVEVNVEMDPLDLDIDEAIPIGLIVNELLTNALKYAFPNEREGTIRIELEEDAPRQLHLLVADNGIGKKATGDAKGTGFGAS